MKKTTIVIIFFLLFGNISFAQKHEVGAFFGGTNTIADIGRTQWVNPLPKRVENSDKLQFPLVFGVMYRYNLNPQQSLRFNLSYASISDDNKNAEENYRNSLLRSYENSILEFSSIFEYNFFPINTEQQNAHSPYIFAGIGIFSTNKNTFRFSKDKNHELIEKKEDEFKVNYSIPFGVGYKYKFNWNWVLGAEVGFRPTFIDYLDKGTVEKRDLHFAKDNFTEDEKSEIIKKYTAEIGDNRKNDWYVFTGLSLTYTFGRPPCFCD